MIREGISAIVSSIKDTTSNQTVPYIDFVLNLLLFRKLDCQENGRISLSHFCLWHKLCSLVVENGAMFFLFFGTRRGKTQSQILHDISCPYCGQTETLTATWTSNYFHLFWLPLFKIGASEIIECSHCKKAYFKDEFTDNMKRKIDRLKWITSV